MVKIPSATYRLQFNREFTFSDARAVVDYLHRLGISDIYASPLLKTPPDSLSGYDVCDHNRLNPPLGSDQDFEELASALQANGQGLILDIVPNHMGISGPCNAWWMDVLENGPSSTYASYFDIDWRPVNPRLENKVLLPILEDQYGNVLEEGKLRLHYEEGAFFIAYHETTLPVTPLAYSTILDYRLDPLAGALGKENEFVQELQSILTAISHLPHGYETNPEKIAELRREKEVIKRRIASLYHASADVRDTIETAVREFNGSVGNPRSFDMLDGLMDMQPYRLAFWRVAGEEINYRRFFDINDLAAIRMELPDVFQASHRLILRLVGERKITGLRIDHPDGLRDPASYFLQLQQSCASELGHCPEADRSASNPDRDQPRTPWPLYVIVEKILSKEEPLPEDWAVYGTTGYDFLNQVNGLFVDRARRKTLDKIYKDFIGTEINFRNLVNSTKKMIMLVSLASDVNSMSHELDRISERNRHYRDFTLNSLTYAIREVIACLSVYRTYNNAATGAVSERDEKYITGAVDEARKRNPRTARALFDFVRDTFLFKNLSHFREEDRPQVIDFVMDIQQLTGPVMAKAVEDTAFYVYNRLASLNEVGGDPEQFGVSLETFHRQNKERLRRWPHSMLATSTHDTKRSEDVRARIDVLSEIPLDWRSALTRWSGLNLARKTAVDGELAPDRNDEYLLYQTLVGAWPASSPGPEEMDDFRDRIAAYMQKAIKEAKVHTSWVNPNEDYDQAVTNFVRSILDPGGDNEFPIDFATFHSRIACIGMLNSLAQTLLKIASPGVPDFYQGTELWNLSLVDPDNRRAVDFSERQRRLEELKRAEATDANALVEDLLLHWDDGRLKLYVIYKGLNFRRSEELLFREGDYVSLYASGRARENVCAFVRRKDGGWALAAVPRLITRLAPPEKFPLGTEVWGKHALQLPPDAPQHWLNVLTGEELEIWSAGKRNAIPLAHLFARFPIALLAGKKTRTSGKRDCEPPEPANGRAALSCGP